MKRSDIYVFAHIGMNIFILFRVVHMAGIQLAGKSFFNYPALAYSFICALIVGFIFQNLFMFNALFQTEQHKKEERYISFISSNTLIILGLFVVLSLFGLLFEQYLF